MLHYTESHYENIEAATAYLRNKYGSTLFSSPLHKPHSLIKKDTTYIVEQDNNVIVGLLKCDTDPQELFAHISLIIYEDEELCLKASEYFKKQNILHYIVDQSIYHEIDYFIHGQKHVTPLEPKQIIEKSAIYIPDSFIQEEYKELLKTATNEVAENHFIAHSNIVLDNYSKWCSGEVFGYSVITYDLLGEVVEEEECFGLVGFYSALKDLAYTIQKYTVENEVNQLAHKVIIQNYSPQFAHKLPFKIDSKDLEQYQHVVLHNHHIVAATYCVPDKAICYCFEEGYDYIIENPYDILQRSYDITPEYFLKMVLLDQVKNILRKHIYQSLYPEKFKH